VSVRVRLTRVGSRKNPVWRVVVADQRSPRDGRVIETVGRYNPQRQPSEIVLDHDRISHWIDRGAQPSDTVRRLIRASSRGASPATEETTTNGNAGAAGPTADGAPASDGDGSTEETTATPEPTAESSPDTPAPEAAEDGTPVAPDGPAEEAGPAAEVPAEEAPPAEAPTAGAPEAEDNA